MSHVAGTRYKAPLSSEEVERILYLRYEESMAATDIARELGCSCKTVYRYAPGVPHRAENATIRKAFMESGLTVHQLAKLMGSGDEPWIRRRLYRDMGMAPGSESIPYETTAKWKLEWIGQALGLDADKCYTDLQSQPKG